MRRLLLAVTLLAAAAACGPGRDTDPRSLTPTSGTVPGRLGLIDDIVVAHTAFTLDLFKAVAGEHRGDNLVLSPHGANVVLSMALAGAKGQTADELRAALHRHDQGDGGVAALAQMEKTLRARTHDDTIVDLTASEWLQKDYPVRADYRALIEQAFGAAAHTVDFAHNAKDATDAINADVARATRDHIPELLKSPLDNDTRLVLISAAYLQARWAHSFNQSATQPADFTTAKGDKVQRPTMRHTEGYATAQGSGWRAISLPYTGGDLSMLVVVPDDIAGFEQSLRLETIDAIVHGLGERHPVDLSLPKFEFRTSGSLRGALNRLGITTAFSDRADLSGIAPGPPPLVVFDVVQEAWVQVDEEGTKAAAATGLIAGVTSAPAHTTPPERFAVDRPFLFLIRDNATGAILFIGRVLDPQSSYA